MSLVEISEAAKVIQEPAHPEAHIIFGANVDDELSESLQFRMRDMGVRLRLGERVVLTPGDGSIEVNKRKLEEYFPRVYLQTVAKQPLVQSGYEGNLNVRVRVHGGGISGQADAVRHGIAKALIEADPALRGELKRRQLLTRDPRVKEGKKASLKKARKRPQFSKR